MRLGSDPEVFLIDPKGKHISSLGFINADKWNPMQIPDMPKGFTLQEDNVSLEYGIPPAATADEFVQHIQLVMARSLEYLPKLSFSKLSCVVFDKDQMDDPRAHIFGCEADYDAWGDTSPDPVTGEPRHVNKKPVPPHEFMRSAGGHIHVETKENPVEVIQAMDLFLGVPSVLMDKGTERRKMYGKAGAHRVKEYGVEYRTLSNFWIFDEKLIRWAWKQTERALNNIGAAKYYERDILAAINNDNVLAAKQLVKECNLELV